MKYFIITFIFCVTSLMPNTVLSQDSDKEYLGKMQQHEGYYMFFFSTPVEDYTTLGYLKEAKVVWTGKPKEMYKLMLKKTRKQYPNADGLIIEDIHMNRIRAIKFN